MDIQNDFLNLEGDYKKIFQNKFDLNTLAWAKEIHS